MLGAAWRSVMRTRWVLLLACGSVVLAAGPGIVRGQPLEMERVLAERFGFSATEIGQLRGSQVVVKTLPAEGREIAVVGAVRIPDDRERLVRWIRDVEGFRKAADLGVSRKLSSPPTINDFGDLALDAGELAALQRCQPGALRPPPGGSGHRPVSRRRGLDRGRRRAAGEPGGATAHAGLRRGVPAGRGRSAGRRAQRADSLAWSPRSSGR